MNTNLDLTKLLGMDIQEIRRKKLRLWVGLNGTPTKEKSYFSQLLGGAAFGEKAARRIEQDYKMGSSYLDTDDESIEATGGNELEEAIKLLAFYRASTEDGRKFIMQAALAAEKVPGHSA